MQNESKNPKNIRKLLDMADALRSILGDGVNLPSDLEPDVSILMYFPRGAGERDSDELCADESPDDCDSDLDEDETDDSDEDSEGVRSSIESIRTACEAEYSLESIKSKYGHCLDPEANFSDKARFRMDFPVLALTQFNKKKKLDYKLVDCLPFCLWAEDEFLIHFNFIARQISPADPSKKLFFAEIQRKGFVQGAANWVVTSCRIIHGCETTAGCLICTCKKGKRVVHPTRGFLFGSHPRKILPPRHPPPIQTKPTLSFEDFMG